jgi:hypothetical protein
MLAASTLDTSVKAVQHALTPQTKKRKMSDTLLEEPRNYDLDMSNTDISNIDTPEPVVKEYANSPVPVFMEYGDEDPEQQLSCTSITFTH